MYKRQDQGFYLGDNPVPKALKKVKLRKERTVKVRALSYEQLATMLGKAKNASTELYLGMALGGYAGMRIGEVGNLRWEDIDLEQGLIRIQPKQEAAGISAWEAKTNNSYRQIPISEELLEILNNLQKDSGYVIEYQGRKISRSSFRFDNDKHWESVTGSFKDFTFHMLRHTFVSMLLNEGRSLEVVSKIIGDTFHTCYNTYFTLQTSVHQGISFKKSSAKE